MALRIHTNLAALYALRRLESLDDRLRRLHGQLASGLRISSAADDPAGLRIAERLRAQVRSLEAALENAGQGASVVRTAEDATVRVLDLLSALRALALEAVGGTTSGVPPGGDPGDDTNGGPHVPPEPIDPRGGGGGGPGGGGAPDPVDPRLEERFQALLNELAHVARTTDHHGLRLLDGSRPSVTVFAGIERGSELEILLPDARPITLGIAGASVRDTDAALRALTALDGALETAALGLARLGVHEEILAVRTRVLAGRELALASAEGRIRDLDVARATAELARLEILQRLGLLVLQRSLTPPELALRLLEGPVPVEG